MLEQAFDDGKICVQMRILLVLNHVDYKFSPQFCLLDQFVTVPAATVFHTTGSSDGVLVSLRLRGGEITTAASRDEKLVSFASIWINSFRVCCTIYVFMLTELKEALDRLKQGASQRPQRVETSETSADETDTSKVRRKFLSKKTFRKKMVYAAIELGRLPAKGPADAVNMPSHFYCRVCRKDVSAFTHGHHEVLQHFHGSRRFARDQRLRLETPSWRVWISTEIH